MQALVAVQRPRSALSGVLDQRRAARPAGCVLGGGAAPAQRRLHAAQLATGLLQRSQRAAALLPNPAQIITLAFCLAPELILSYACCQLADSLFCVPHFYMCSLMACSSAISPISFFLLCNLFFLAVMWHGLCSFREKEEVTT